MFMVCVINGSSEKVHRLIPACIWKIKFVRREFYMCPPHGWEKLDTLFYFIKNCCVCVFRQHTTIPLKIGHLSGTRQVRRFGVRRI